MPGSHFPGIHTERLDNGLRVVVQPHGNLPLAAIYLQVDVGSAYERPHEHGAAHFLEHMLFKGTPSRGLTVAAGTVEGLGGDLNAWTSLEETVLHATVTAEGLDTALAVLADMARNSLLDPDELEKERQVVLEELRGYESEADSVLEELGLRALYPDHGYGRPIVGHTSEVTGLQRADLLGFWRRCWGPSRARLIIVGDVGVVEAIELAQRHLGDWRDEGEPEQPKPPAPIDGPIWQTCPGDFASEATEISWRTVPLGHSDAAALDVLAQVLCSGTGSLVAARLQLDEGLIADPWASSSLKRLAGELTMGFTPLPGKAQRAVQLALEVVEAVKARGVAADRVDRARSAILADMAFGIETVDGTASELAWYTSNYGSHTARERLHRAVSSVTPGDVQRVAQRWLVPTQRVVTSHVPLSPIEPTAAHAQELPGPSEHVLDNGCVILLRPTDEPIFAVEVLARGGDLTVPARHAGLPTAWATLVMAGTTALDPEAWHASVERIGGAVSAAPSRHATRLHGSFPAESAHEGLALVLDALLDPGFDSEEWARIQDELLDELRTLPDRPGELLEQMCWAAHYPGHPWRLPTTGTEASLKGLTHRTIARWHRARFTGPATTVCLVGGFDPERALDLLKDYLNELPDIPMAPSVSAPIVSPAKRMHRVGGREQAHIVMCCRGPGYGDKHRLEAGLLTTILSAQGGRLFLELRERRGLAYSVWASSVARAGGGLVQFGLSTAPERASQAEQALRESIDALRHSPIREGELERGKKMALGHAAIALQRCSARASHQARIRAFGLRGDLDQLASALNAITPQRMEQTVANLLARPWTTVRVDPKR